MEFEFDVIYESIDDLPASVFEDIALSFTGTTRRGQQLRRFDCRGGRFSGF